MCVFARFRALWCEFRGVGRERVLSQSLVLKRLKGIGRAFCFVGRGHSGLLAVSLYLNATGRAMEVMPLPSRPDRERVSRR